MKCYLHASLLPTSYSGAIGKSIIVVLSCPLGPAVDGGNVGVRWASVLGRARLLSVENGERVE